MEFVKKDGEEYVIIGKKDKDGNYTEKPLVFGVCHNKCCEQHENLEHLDNTHASTTMKCKVCGHIHDYS